MEYRQTIGIVPKHAISYTSRDREIVKFSIGELFNRFPKSKTFTGKGALFSVRGEHSEPIRGDDVYERLCRKDAIEELKEAARDRVDSETFRATIERFLTDDLEE